MLSFLYKWYGVFLFCSPFLLGAQDLIVTYDIINEDDGLRNSSVFDLMMDSRGLIWIATMDGLHSYDGYSFTVYDNQSESPAKLSSNAIYSVAEDEEGHIWIATDNGINVLNPLSQTVKMFFNSGNNQFPRSEGSDGNCRILKDHEGVFWILEGGYLGQFVNGHFKYLHKETIKGAQEMFLDQDNKIYLRVASGPTIILQNGQIVSRPYTFNYGEILGYSVYNNDKKQLVSAFFEGGLAFYDLESHQFVRLNPKENTLDDIILKMLKNELDLNQPILGRAQNNIVYKITKVMEDEGGLFWIATNLGIINVAIQKSDFHTIDTLRNISLRGMYEHADGTIYCGAYAPFFFFQYNPVNESIKQFDIWNVWDVKPFNKDTLMLLNNSTNVSLFDLNLQRLVYKNELRPILNYHRGAIIISGRKVIIGAEKHGLYIAPIDDLDQFTTFHAYNDTLLSQLRVNCLLAESDSVFWVGSTNTIVRVNWITGITKYFDLPGFDSGEGKHQEVYHMYQNKKGALWLATTKGLVYFDPMVNVMTTYTTRDGLPDNLIYSLQSEDSSAIWLATHNGLSRFNIAEQRFNNYSEADGISNNEFNRNSYLKCKDGQLYFGGIGGFTAFHPKNIQQEEVRFKPFISSYAIYDKERNRIQEYVPSTETGGTIRLDPRDRNVTFTVSVSDYNNPVKANFQVQLIGFDDNRINLGNKRVVRYTNLDAGVYTFKVRAANHEGLWSNKEASLRLIVSEPFYTSNWFYGLIALITLLGISSFFYFRLTYEIKSNNLRNRIANDLHDEVSNTLNNIRITASEAEQSEGKSISGKLNRIKQMSSYAIEHVEDVIWAIDQDKKSIKYLLFRMEDNVDRLLRSRQIPVQFEKENLNESAELNFLHRRNLLLIFKETLSNIVKHTHSEKVLVRIGNKDGQFFLSVVNSFSRKKDTTYKTGRGTISMTQRAAALKGKFLATEKEDSYEVLLKLNRPL